MSYFRFAAQELAKSGLYVSVHQLWDSPPSFRISFPNAVFVETMFISTDQAVCLYWQRE